MKHSPMAPVTGLILVVLLSGCATTSVIDLSSPDSGNRLAGLNAKTGEASVWTRSASEGSPLCASQKFSARRFEVAPDSTVLWLARGESIVLRTDCLLSITLARRGRGAATGLVAGGTVGAGGGLLIAALAWFVTAIGGESLSGADAAAMVGFSALTVGAVGAGFGWIRGAPLRYRFTGSPPPLP